eukprot:TRINITY_DN4809_c0_g1_i5.p1 TRINITY_DN4809_c0_g1~~TRINITY_DN4809_c0_g1_i5.p1  ORF type:complete len:190 (-),score=11.08 TRINITY_DN4809_c0_g1_i5:53-622(-)
MKGNLSREEEVVWTASELGDWVYFPSMDSPGNDIERNGSLAGRDNFLRQRARAEGMGAGRCVAFNTDGWFKSKIHPKSQWRNLLTGDFKNGLWVLNSALADLEWVLVPETDSYGYDIAPYNMGPVNIRARAEALGEACVAYNSDGNCKYYVRPRAQWECPHERKVNLWVRRSYFERMVPYDGPRMSPRG